MIDADDWYPRLSPGISNIGIDRDIGIGLVAQY